jgi:hypothetical protein
MSHLSTLIGRVRMCEFAGCPESEECGAGAFIEQALREKLLNLAEYMTYSYDYDQRESLEATELLWKHGMEGLICNPTGITEYLQKINEPRQAQMPVQATQRPVGVVS